MPSKSLIVVAVALAFVTVGWLTVQSSIVIPLTASSEKGVSDPGYAAQFAGANITTADEEDSYQTMQPSMTGW